MKDLFDQSENLIYVKPLGGYVIRRNNLSPDQEYVLDKLNPDLSFKKKVAAVEPDKNLDQAKREFILTNKIKPGGWVKVEAKYSMEETMKIAMDEIRQRVKAKA